MAKTVNAVYEDGRLILQEPLPLPDHSRVRVTVATDTEREAWLAVSEEALGRAWGDAADDVFNELLTR